MRYTSLLTILAGTLIGNAQTIDASRTTDWSLAGLKSEFNLSTNTIDFVSNGGIPDGSTDNSATMSTILSGITGDATIFFEDGDYLFTESIILPENVSLKGESNGARLLFNLSTETHGIIISGALGSETDQLASDANQGDLSITISGSGNFAAGDYIRIDDDDTGTVTDSWAIGSTGQIARIESVNGSTLELESPLRRDFTTSLSGSITSINPLEGISIEELSIVRLDQTTQQTSNIKFEYAANCRVKCIDSYMSNYSHIELNNSANIDITGCHIKAGHDYGSGGKAYGVVCQFATSECLIEDNAFDSLRHAMLIQAGGNGNVYAYNYSQNPYWTGTILPAGTSGDMVLHGNYPYMNLFEGNVCQNIVIDDAHGSNGKFNTFFRNRAEYNGIFMNASPASNSQNIVGNEITNMDFFLGAYTISGSDQFEYGNNKKGIPTPSGTMTIPEESLYLASTPNYYANNNTFPPIGYPKNLNEEQNEIQFRYGEGNLIKCQNDSLDDTGIYLADRTFDLVAYPNPADAYLNVQVSNQIAIRSIYIKAINGKLISTHTSNGLDVSDLPQGIYLIEVVTWDERKANFKFIKG